MGEADEDELDYYVTFPPAISSGATKEPVVVILGWMGCLDKHLVKYSAIYQAKGYTTIRYTAPKLMIMVYPDRARDIARKLLELLFDLGLEENRVIFHVFSNGGSFVFRHMMELATNGESPEFAQLKIAGSILDSTPTDPKLLAAARAMYHSADRVTPLLVLLIALFLLIGSFISMFVPWRFRTTSSLPTHVKSISESEIRTPQLFLYSTKDPICDYRLVEEVIAKRRAAGVEVWQQCWSDTDHVAHFRVHKEAYMEKVTSFVEFCLDQ